VFGPFEHPLFDLRHNTALYSSGGAAGITDHGPNAGKTVDSMQFGGDGYSYLTVTKDGYVKEYDVMYTGGSHDHMRQEYSTTSNGTQTTGSVTSFDANGNKVDKNNVAGDKWTEPDGTKGWKYEYTKPVTDEKGNVVGSEVGTFSLIQNPDGSSIMERRVRKDTHGQRKAADP
jgi:hypothetical protein